MPRTPRSFLPDGPFHVMSRAIHDAHLFRSDVDRRRYLGLLQLVVERQGWRVSTFVLMDSHVHLLVTARTEALSRGLWWLNWQYAEFFKERYDPHFGHVFGARPKTKPIRHEAYFKAVVRYIARNPIGSRCAGPSDYRWSAHRAITGEAPRLPFLARDDLLAWFGSVDRYEAFVEGADAEHPCGPPSRRADSNR